MKIKSTLGWLLPVAYILIAVLGWATIGSYESFFSALAKGIDAAFAMLAMRFYMLYYEK